MIRQTAALAGLLVAASLGAQEPAGWKLAAKLGAPSAPAWAAIAPDGRRVYMLCPERRKSPSGGPADAILFRAFDAAGKEVFARDMGFAGDVRVAMSPGRVALSDGFDRVLIFDADSWTLVSTVDTRSPSDLPPDLAADENAGGRLTDIELMGDGKTLVTVRPENAAWKKVGPAWLGESTPAAVFWDADTGKKIGSLAAADRTAHGGFLTYMPLRKEMLVRFDNGARLLDVGGRKWGREFPLKEACTAAVSPDEKRVAVAGRDQTVKVFNLDDGAEIAAFKVPVINKTPFLDGSAAPTSLAFGPAVQFADAGKALKITLNDGKTIVYRSSLKGEKIEAPATETMRFPTAGKMLALSADGKSAVTTSFPPSGKCTLWTRE